MWLHDTGILDKLRRDTLPHPHPIPKPKVRHNEPLIFDQLGITMILFLIGILISIFVFLWERFQSHKGERKHSKDMIELTVMDSNGRRLISEWIYTNHQHNWRRNHTQFVSVTHV